MQAIILSGGKGTRLHPLTLDTPKPMLPINDVPHLEYQIELLKKHGIVDIVFSTGYLHQCIEEYFGNGEDFGVNITYRVDGEIPLGTAGAIVNCLDVIYDDFIVMNGDILTDINLSELIKFHQERDRPISMAIIDSDEPESYGVVSYEGEVVNGFIEKSQVNISIDNRVNAGIYLFGKDLLSKMPKGKYMMLETDIFPEYATNGLINAYICSKSKVNWLDIGTHVRYKAAQRLNLCI